MALPTLPPLRLISERLPLIFPEGTPHRTFCTRDVAAKTIYVMFYIGAIKGADRWLAPKQVYRMGNAQAAMIKEQDREIYFVNSMRQGFRASGKAWYADNTREPIRDETLKEGLGRVGAVVFRTEIATTAGKGRYALDEEFASLFSASLKGKEFEARVAAWQASRLTAEALARVQILRRGGVALTSKIPVSFPNGEVRQMEAGPSSVISKAVIEDFGPRFLERPAVIFLSESGNKIVARDDALARDIGLKIEASNVLPDIILVDLGPAQPLLVFVEVVATDGAVSESRKAALAKIASNAGFREERLAFVTAYRDRDAAAFKKTVPVLAWNSFAWFASEPGQIIILRGGITGRDVRLSNLL
jgi:hypothetical protein